jgi:hypothetical protein
VGDDELHVEAALAVVHDAGHDAVPQPAARQRRERLGQVRRVLGRLVLLQVVALLVAEVAREDVRHVDREPAAHDLGGDEGVQKGGRDEEARRAGKQGGIPRTGRQQPQHRARSKERTLSRNAASVVARVSMFRCSCALPHTMQPGRGGGHADVASSRPVGARRRPLQVTRS